MSHVTSRNKEKNGGRKQLTKAGFPRLPTMKNKISAMQEVYCRGQTSNLLCTQINVSYLISPIWEHFEI